MFDTCVVSWMCHLMKDLFEMQAFLDFKDNILIMLLQFQYFDAVGWAAGRASGL